MFKTKSVPFECSYSPFNQRQVTARVAGQLP